MQVSLRLRRKEKYSFDFHREENQFAQFPRRLSLVKEYREKTAIKMAENEPKELQEEEVGEDEVDGLANEDDEQNGEDGDEVKSRSKRSIINVPDREYIKDGVKYRKDRSGKWRPVIELDFDDD